MTNTEKTTFDKVGGGVPFYKELGRVDGADKSRKYMRSVPQYFEIAYTEGFYEGKKGVTK